MSGARSTKQDPLKGYNFAVALPGFKRNGFMYCSGIEMSAEVMTYREGGGPPTVQSSPGLITYAPITLRRGLIVDDENAEQARDFYYWWMQVRDRDPNMRRNGSIILMSNDLLEGPKWDFVNAWPSNFKPFGELTGDANNNLIEEITITHEGLTWAGGAIAPPTPGQSIASQLGLG